MSFHFSSNQNTNRFTSFILLSILICSHLLASIDTLTASGITTLKPTLTIGTVGLSNTTKIQNTSVNYKERIVAAKKIVEFTKNTKKPISFVNAMRTVSTKSSLVRIPTNTKLASSTIKPSLKAQNRVEKTNLASKNMTLSNLYISRQLINSKKKSDTTSTADPIVLNSVSTVPIVGGSSGGGGSPAPTTAIAPISSAPVIATPIPTMNTTVPVASAPATVTIPVITTQPILAPVASVPFPVAPVNPATLTIPVITTQPAPVPVAPVATPVSSTTTPLNIINPQNPQLKKLLEYQRATGMFVSDHLMIFMTMPQSTATIEGTSYYMANIANEFALYNITPIFVFEPIGDNGVQLNLGRLRNGDYSANLELLFSMLKNNRSIPENKLGIMVPYPEINTPAFNRANFVPENLPTMVNIFFDSIKKFYPNVQGGLLLDSKSYDIGKSWGQGGYNSFAPYLMGIKYGHIQTFGIQGFPWASNDASIKVYDPAVFIPNNLTEEAANILGIKKVWFNTGTMKRQYPTSTVNVTTAERTTTLNGIVNQADLLKAKGFIPLIHIFAQDKFAMGEGIDWSYMENGGDGVLSPHEAVFKTFLEKTQAKGYKIGLFDL